MAAERLKGTASAGFDGSGGGGAVSLSIENDPGAYSGGDEIHLLLFPAVAATIRADVGEIRVGSPKVVQVPGGVVTISGTSASLPKRADAVNPNFSTMFAFDKAGNAIAVGITYDPASNELRADRECTAAVAYTAYATTALQFIYVPKLETIGPAQSSIATFGTIVAFYPPDNICTFDASPFNLDQGNSIFEMYRIVSAAITTREGEFEKPPNFPASGAYPGKALVLDTATFLETERVHEIGSMTRTGAIQISTYFVKKLEPYGVGDLAYNIPKVLKESSLPTDMFPKEIILKAKNEVKRRGQGKL